MDDIIIKEYEKLEKDEKNVEINIKDIDKRISLFNKIGWGLIVLGFVLGLGGVILQFVWSTESEGVKLHEIGDFFGGTVASIWALSGLFFIYIAFLGQQKQMLYQNLELQLNRIEVKANRLELSAQKDQMILQNQTIRLQRFENTFFNLISILHEMVKNIKIHQFKKPYDLTEATDIIPLNQIEENTPQLYYIDGKKCFVTFYEHFKNYYIEAAENQKLSIKEVIETAFRKFYKENEADLRHYFQNIFQIIFLIEKSDLENKSDYVELFRSQFSTHELLIIYYYCLSLYKKEWFTIFLEKHRFLKDFNLGHLIEFNHHMYHEKIFYNVNN